MGISARLLPIHTLIKAWMSADANGNICVNSTALRQVFAASKEPDEYRFFDSKWDWVATELHPQQNQVGRLAAILKSLESFKAAEALVEMPFREAAESTGALRLLFEMHAGLKRDVGVRVPQALRAKDFPRILAHALSEIEFIMALEERRRKVQEALDRK